MSLHSSYLDASEFWPLFLIQSALAIHCSKLEQAHHILSLLPQAFKDCPEAVRLRCRIFERTGAYDSSLELLLIASKRFPQDLSLRLHLLDCAIKARSQDKTVPILNQFLSDFGPNKKLLTLYSQIRMLQYRTADSRRLILQNRCWNTIEPNQESISSNLYNTYSSLALGDWLQFSPFCIDPSRNTLELSLRENLCMQTASLESTQYPTIVGSVLSDYASERSEQQIPSFSAICIHNKYCSSFI